MEGNYLFEKWKFIEFSDNICECEVFQISNYGRVKSFKKDKVNGMLYKVHPLHGYYKISLIQKSGKRTSRYIHKFVAEAFIPKDSEDQIYVIHRDYNKLNNRIDNLAWATKEEKEFHQFRNTEYLAGTLRKSRSKLSEGEVRIIKKLINDPNRKTRMKMIAKRFGVSEMQLYRIKSGENWGHIKVD